MRRTSLTLAALVVVLSTAASSQQAPAVKEDAPGLLARATVTPAQALPIAMAKVPNGVLHSAEIEQEDDKLVYSFDIKAPGKPGVEEVVVDAMTGKVVGVEHESDEVEAKEQRTEKKASP